MQPLWQVSASLILDESILSIYRRLPKDDVLEGESENKKTEQHLQYQGPRLTSVLDDVAHDPFPHSRCTPPPHKLKFNALKHGLESSLSPIPHPGPDRLTTSTVSRVLFQSATLNTELYARNYASYGKYSS